MRRLLLIVLAGAGIVASLAVFGARWNVSDSVAPGLYVKQVRPLERGDLVSVCLPEAVGRWAVRRGYLGRGGCPGDSARLGKWIAGVEGDRVEVKGKGIRVNGRWLEGTRRVDYDSGGRPVPLVPEGTVVLGPGEVWLHSGRRARSLDSRVFGALEVANVRGILEPLWVLDGD